MNSTKTQEFSSQGYCWLEGMFCEQTLDAWRERIDDAMESDSESILRSRGEVYGARNLLSLIPDIVLALQYPELKSFCDGILGSEWGVVRGLYFDKPLEASWSLPWHQDMTIAVESNQLSSGHFCNPTQKAGVDHVEAPNWLLEKMLTIRIHLDPMTKTNGPMLVQPGSHQNGKYSKQALNLEAPVTLQCNVGDVLAMRPLFKSFEHSVASRKPIATPRCAFGVIELPGASRWI